MLRVFKENKWIKRTFSILVILIIVVVTILTITVHNLTYGSEFSNSYLSSAQLTKGVAMVVTPHEDDEIPVAGAMIKSLADNDWEVYIVFTTNGDYEVSAKTRLQEAIDAAAVLGVEESHVIFLGYGDQWEAGGNHIYNSPSDEGLESYAGFLETYGMEGHLDFRSEVSGEPSLYTRDNLKTDLGDVLAFYLPDVIYAVDFDSHPDHRATSLLFEEVLPEVLKSEIDYSPTVYKGYSYNTAWNAIEDYYGLNMASTLLPDRDRVNDFSYDVDTPQYSWEDRVRFPVPSEALSYTLRSNVIYKALAAHKSQYAKLRAISIINSDMVFWERRTDSLTYEANISVSSSVATYLNDFKLIDTKDVNQQPAIIEDCVWMPLAGDQQKQVRIVFDTPQTVSLVSLYDHFSVYDNILSGRLIFSDGSVVAVGALAENGAKTDIEFESKDNITDICFIIDEYEGETPGLCEIEVFSEGVNTEVDLIKLVADNESQQFIYSYVLGEDEEISFNVYSYPFNELDEDDYVIEIVDDGNGKATLEGDTLSFENDVFPKTCTVRVELVINPEVYDEVEIISYSVLNNYVIKGIQSYEAALNRLNYYEYRIKQEAEAFFDKS